MSATCWASTVQAANATEPPEQPSVALPSAVAVLIAAITLVVVCYPSRKGTS